MEDGTGSLLPVLVMTLAYSRFVLARMIPSRATQDLLLGMWLLLHQLGRVPRRLIWDNERGIGRGRHRSVGVPAFTGTLATQLVLLKPRDPESKGVVERRNGWFETSFMPGREFASPTDFNQQFSEPIGLVMDQQKRLLVLMSLSGLTLEPTFLLACYFSESQA